MDLEIEIRYSMRVRDFVFKEFPLGYFITFRTHGTWLHGDPRGSVDRHHNSFGEPLIPANLKWEAYNSKLLETPPVRLKRTARSLVKEAIKETCKIRGWNLWIVNALSNHIHSVVSAQCKPEPVLIALKANATRKLRESGLWTSRRSPGSERGSKRSLWSEKALIDAIVYVQYDQGED